MEFSAQQIASVLGGTVEGDPEVKVNNFSKIEEGKPGTLTFLANPKYEHFIYQTEASIVLVNNDFTPAEPVKATLVKVANAYASLAILLNMAEQANVKKAGIDATAFIAGSATVGEGCYVGNFAYIGEDVKIGKNSRIYPHAYIGDHVTIGDNCTVYPHATIYNGCVIGNNCILHAGSVIGSDGFGFAPEGDNYKKIPQLGNVVLEDDVEIGANTTIDRAVMDSTIIRRGCQTGQSGTNCSQRGSRRKHGHGSPGRHCGFRKDRQPLHVRRPGRTIRPYPCGGPCGIRCTMRRDQRCKRTGNPVRCSGYQRKGVYAFQRNLQPPAGYVPPDGTDAT